MTEQLTRRRFVAGVGAASIGSVALAGCSGSDASPGAGESDSASNADPSTGNGGRPPIGNDYPVAITSHEIDPENGGYAYVDVAVENVSEYDVGFVAAHVYHYNAAGERIADGVDSTTHVPPGEEVRFDVPMTVKTDAVDKYAVDVRARW